MKHLRILGLASFGLSLLVGFVAYQFGCSRTRKECSAQYCGVLGGQHLAVLRKVHQELAALPISETRTIVEGEILREIFLVSNALKDSNLEQEDNKKYKLVMERLGNKVDYSISNDLLVKSGIAGEPWNTTKWKLNEPWFVDSNLIMSQYVKELFDKMSKQ